MWRSVWSLEVGISLPLDSWRDARDMTDAELKALWRPFVQLGRRFRAFRVFGEESGFPDVAKEVQAP